MLKAIVCSSLLNAHPEIVISHELDALHYAARGISREALFALILRRERWFARAHQMWEDYDYSVPNQWQGRYSQMKVIGDKKGGTSTKRLRANPELLELLQQTVQLPIRIIHIVRNPFDNISRISLRSGRSIEMAARRYFESANTNNLMLQKSNPRNVLTYRHEQFIASPTESLGKLLEFVGLGSDKAYLSDCASIVFPEPRRSRFDIAWSRRHIDAVSSELSKYPFLQGYTFND
jgi:hypothetical protein